MKRTEVVNIPLRQHQPNLTNLAADRHQVVQNLFQVLVPIKRASSSEEVSIKTGLIVFKMLREIYIKCAKFVHLNVQNLNH